MKLRAFFAILLLTGLTDGVILNAQPPASATPSSATAPSDTVMPPPAPPPASAPSQGTSLPSKRDVVLPSSLPPANPNSTDATPTAAQRFGRPTTPLVRTPPTPESLVATTANSAKTGWAALPYRFIKGPVGGEQIVRTELRKPTSVSFIGVSQPLDIMPPLATYGLPADFQQGAGLDKAVFGGYYYLIESAGQPVADADVANYNGAARWTGLGTGQFVQLRAQALADLATLDQVKKGSYEPRLLGTGTTLISLWLKSDNGSPDIIYLLYPIPTKLVAGKAYTVDEVFSVLRPVLAEVSAAWARTDAQRLQRMSLPPPNPTQ